MSTPGRATAAAAVARRPTRPPIRSITTEYVESLKLYADVLFKGGLVPKGLSRSEAVAAVIEVGRDVGLPPTQALANIVLVNGRRRSTGTLASR